MHPANMNVLTSTMEKKQVQAIPAQQTADRHRATAVHIFGMQIIFAIVLPK